MITDFARGLVRERRAQMQAELMAEKVEIDPCISRAPFGGTKGAGLEFSGFIQIGNVEREMEGMGHVWSSFARRR